MEKKSIRVNVGQEVSFNADYDEPDPTVDEVMQYLISVKEAGATHIEWDTETSWDGCSPEECEAQAYYMREETDEEYNIRAKQEENKRKVEEEKSLAAKKLLYEQLKQEFGL